MLHVQYRRQKKNLTTQEMHKPLLERCVPTAFSFSAVTSVPSVFKVFFLDVVGCVEIVMMFKPQKHLLTPHIEPVGEMASIRSAVRERSARTPVCRMRRLRKPHLCVHL